MGQQDYAAVGFLFIKYCYIARTIFPHKLAEVLQKDRQWFLQELSANDAVLGLRDTWHPNSTV